MYRKNILFLIFLFHIYSYSQIMPDEQVIFYDYCPFECCQFGEWIIKDNINVYQEEGDTSSIIFRLNINDTIFARTGNLHFVQVGKVVVTKPIYDYEINDTLSAYNCQEGSFLLEFNGKKNYVDIFWPTFFSDEDDTEENYLTRVKKGEYSGRMIQRPETVWWVKIESKNGKGWIRLKNKTPYCFSLDVQIIGMDGCG
jgi:hypothetical protein